MTVIVDMGVTAGTMWQPKLQNRFRLEKFSNIYDWEAIMLNLIKVDLKTYKDPTFRYDRETPNTLLPFKDFYTDIILTIEDDVAGRVTRSLSSISGNLNYDITIANLNGNETILQNVVLLGAIFQSVDYTLDYAASATAKYVVKFTTKLCSFEVMD